MPLSRRDFLRFIPVAAAAASALPLQGLVRGGDGGRKKIIIVGAGLAGLTAGYELKRAGHDVVILEARGRPGGRVHTLREGFEGGLYAEAGAARIPDNHTGILAYIGEFELPLVPFRPARMPSVAYLNGKRVVVPSGGTVRWPLPLREEEQLLGITGMRERYVYALLREAGEEGPWPPDSLKRYGGMSWTQFLESRGASPAAVRLLTLGHNAALVESASALLWLRYASAAMKRKRFHKIAGGNDLLPRAFAARLGGRIRYAAPVVAMAQSARSVGATFLEAGRRQTETGDLLLCTVPFSVLKGIAVTPPFSPGRRETVAALEYASAAKVVLGMKRRFWARAGLDGFAVTDLPLGEVWDASFRVPGDAGVLLAYTTGRHARDLCGMTERERIEGTLRQLESVYPGSRDAFTGGASVCWDDDPWTRGGWAFFRAGAAGAPAVDPSEPEGRIFFAGEHASDLPGWMEGAVISGRRAAAAIDAAARADG